MWWSRSCISARSNMSLRVLGAPCHDWPTCHLRVRISEEKQHVARIRLNKSPPNILFKKRDPLDDPVFFWGFCKFTISYYWLNGWRSAGMSFQNLGDVVMLNLYDLSANEANKWLHWNWFVTCACLKFVANSIEACLSSSLAWLTSFFSAATPIALPGEGWHCVESISRLRAAGVALPVRKWSFAGVLL